MKAISLWQPWASAIAYGSKHIETRDWPTKYRGPIAIHAAKRMNKTELILISSCWCWRGALYNILKECPIRNGCKFLWDVLPFGAIVAVCELTDCRPTGSFTQDELDSLYRPEGRKDDLYSWTERQMGDFTLGRYGWILKHVRQIDPPIPCKGQRGIFNISGNIPVFLKIQGKI